MAFDLSGKFDYTSLRRELKDNGIKEIDLSSALRQIASDNNIDNVRNLDGTQNITISKNIFEEANEKAVSLTSSINPVDNALLSFDYFNSNDVKAAKTDSIDSLENAPEIYNDDDYEVAEYDDFYGFSDKVEEKEDENNEEIDLETFKNQYATDIIKEDFENSKAQNEFLEKVFQNLDVNSSNTLSKDELQAAFYAGTFASLNDKKDETIPQEGNYDPLEGAMEMDMQNDSFNPKG